MPRARILAVDDQRYFRELMERLLTEEGYTTQTASSAEEALRILESDRFDVVLTDLVMPGVDGGELVQRIKARDPDQEIVVGLREVCHQMPLPTSALALSAS